MAHAVVPIESLSPERRARFRALTATPARAWPALALWALVMTVYVGSDVLAFAGRMPLWLGMCANSVIGYLAFTVTHDSIHRSISRTTWLNDAIGQTTVFIGAPYVDLRLFRWAHIR